MEYRAAQACKMQLLFCGFSEPISFRVRGWSNTQRLAGNVGTYIRHTMSFSAALAAIVRSLNFLSFRSKPRQGAKNTFPVMEFCTVKTAMTIQRRVQATVKTWER
jgi:hypothetical protein